MDARVTRSRQAHPRGGLHAHHLDNRPLCTSCRYPSRVSRRALRLYWVITTFRSKEHTVCDESTECSPVAFGPHPLAPALEPHESGTVLGRAVLNESPECPAGPVRRPVIQAMFTVWRAAAGPGASTAIRGLRHWPRHKAGNAPAAVRAARRADRRRRRARGRAISSRRSPPLAPHQADRVPVYRGRSVLCGRSPGTPVPVIHHEARINHANWCGRYGRDARAPLLAFAAGLSGTRPGRDITVPQPRCCDPLSV